MFKSFFAQDNATAKLATLLTLVVSIINATLQQFQFGPDASGIVMLVAGVLGIVATQLNANRVFRTSLIILTGYQALSYIVVSNVVHNEIASQILVAVAAVLKTIAEFSTDSTPAPQTPTPATGPTTLPAFALPTTSALLLALALLLGLGGCVTYQKCLTKFGQASVTDTTYIQEMLTMTVPRDSVSTSFKTDTTHYVETVRQGRATLTIIREPVNTTVLAECRDSVLTQIVERPVLVKTTTETGVAPWYKIAFWGVSAGLGLAVVGWLSARSTQRSTLRILDQLHTPRG